MQQVHVSHMGQGQHQQQVPKCLCNESYTFETPSGMLPALAGAFNQDDS